MRPLVRPHTDAAGGQWFAVTAIFPTEALSVAAYQHVLAALPRGDLGFYRHGLPEVGGTCTSGVSVKRAEALRLARLLGARGGEDVELAELERYAKLIRRHLLGRREIRPGWPR